jgi:hypothetical protein
LLDEASETAPIAEEMKDIGDEELIMDNSLYEDGAPILIVEDERGCAAKAMFARLADSFDPSAKKEESIKIIKESVAELQADEDGQKPKDPNVAGPKPAIPAIGGQTPPSAAPANAKAKAKGSHWLTLYVAHVLLPVEGKQTTFVTDDIPDAYGMTASALDKAGLPGTPITLFFDGEKALIEKFALLYEPCGISVLYILDWFHVKKKACELMSSAPACPLEEKKGMKRDVLRLLYHGKTLEALCCLLALPHEKVKKEKMNGVMCHLIKNFKYIPNYCLRKRLGLKISSQMVEKAKA